MTGATELRNLREVLRDELVERDRIAALLRHGPKTVPEIARALGVPEHEAMMWVMAMRRFGRVRELPKGRSED